MHYSVFVFTPEPPHENDWQVLKDTLQPFHEFECTGVLDQYVVPVDKTEEVRGEWKECMEPMIVDLQGVQHPRYDDQFYRDPTPEETRAHPGMMGMGFGSGIHWSSKDWEDGRGYRAKVHFIPEGWEQVDVPTTRTFLQYAEDWTGRSATILETPEGEAFKYGWIQVDSNNEVLKIISRTNPRAQWDWWAVGGRWSNLLMRSTGPCDFTPISDLDLDGILEIQKGWRREAWQRFRAEFPNIEEAELLKTYGKYKEVSHTRYERLTEWSRANRGTDRPSREDEIHWNGTEGLGKGFDDFLKAKEIRHISNAAWVNGFSAPDGDPEKWINSATRPTPRAMLLDGQWIDKEDRIGWDQHVWDTVDTVAGRDRRYWLTVVDIHK